MLAIGELLWDIFPDEARLGGSAANVAFHAAACGAESTLASRVGRDTYGKRAVLQLATCGVNVEMISEDPRAPTGRVAVTFHGSEPSFEIESDAAWDHIELAPPEILAEWDVICLSTLAQRTPLLRQRIQSRLRAVRQRGFGQCTGGASPTRPIIIVDLNLRPPFIERETVFQAAALADVLKINEQELAWVGRESGVQDPARWLLKNFNLSLLAITRGAAGAELRGHQVTINAPGIRVTGGDAVGAGDAFVARFAVALCEGLNWGAALDSANRYASWVASEHGAMPVRR